MKRRAVADVRAWLKRVRREALSLRRDYDRQADDRCDRALEWSREGVCMDAIDYVLTSLPTATQKLEKPWRQCW